MLPTSTDKSDFSPKPVEDEWQTVDRTKTRRRKTSRPNYSGKSVSDHPPCATRFQGAAVSGVREWQGVSLRSLRGQDSAASVSEAWCKGRQEKKEVVDFEPLPALPKYSTSLVDIGANLIGDWHFPDFSTVIDEAARCGVGGIIITGTSVKASVQIADKMREISRPQVSTGLSGVRGRSAPCALYYTAGCHPHAARFYEDEGGIRVLRNLLLRDDSGCCVAIGECGLDYHYKHAASREVQRTVFRDQLGLAVELGKPVFLHERDAHDDFVAILRRFITKLPVPEMACVHCFSGNRTQLQDYLDLGCSIGITGWIADKRNGDLLDALRSVGWEALRERLMIETDAPYLRPYLVMPAEQQPKTASRSGKKPNVPANLPYVCHAVGIALGVCGEEVAATTTANAKRIFALDE